VIALHGVARVFGPPFALVYGRMSARGLSKLKQMMESGAL
jgi:hypothetical protein